MKFHPHNPRFARLSLLLIAASAVAAIASAEGLPRSTPEAEGMSAASLHGFVDTLDRQIEGMHSVMVVRHGKVVAEGWWAPYAAEHNHVLYSLSKSFTSTAVGLAVAEGKLDVRDPVLKFFPDDGPAEPDENLRAMRVRDLLTMATGHRNEPPRSPDTVSAASFLAHPVTHQPGTRFLYNTPATFMQSAIVQKVTGQTVLDYLKPRLFDPLGIEHPGWDTNFEGISLGGYGLRVRTEDIAKLGQLYLQKGQWNGRQLLPAEWVAQATSRQIPNGDNPDSDWARGYGFQFWMCRHGAYRGDGAFGQYCVVMPEQDVVVAITSGVTNMQAVLNVIWKHVLPAVEHKTAAAAPDSAEKLRTKLAGLEVPAASGNASSPMADAIFGRRYAFPENDRGIESLSVIPSDGAKTVTLMLSRGGRESRIPCGYRTWQQGQAPFDAGPLARFPDEPVAGTFAWETEDTLLLKICAYETPFAASLKLQFSGDRMTLDARSNVAFGPTRHPQLTGQATPSPGARTFDGSISREVLERYLARSISMEGLLNGRGDLEDNIRMLRDSGAKFIGRSLCLWGGESKLLSNLERARLQAPLVHAADPDMILQACIFEIVTSQVDQVPVPDWAFKALGQPVEKRNFRYADMLYPDGRHHDHWRKGSSVPDVSRPETKLWFHFLAASYIDLGIEAIHFGQTELMNGNDPNLDHYSEVLTLIRGYAAKHARRHILLCDSHVPSGGLRRDGRLLMDFHSFPLRIKEVPDRPQEAILQVGFVDSIYGRSKGGITPSGWSCEHLPYLVEIDNWGVSRTPGKAGAGSIWIWGYDEITWFAHQSRQYRGDWLRYAWDWVRRTDPNGYLQMPGSRTLRSPLDSKRWYHANNPSAAVPTGLGDEDAIRTIWASHSRRTP